MHSLPYEYVDKKVTPWGGLRLVQAYYEGSGLKAKFRESAMYSPMSGAGYDHYEIAESFMISVILGANRLVESSTLRFDDVVKEIFGWKMGMPSQSSLSRFLAKYNYDDSDRLFISLWKSWFETIKMDKVTLDIDSTVITRYGHQEGVEIGYNKDKPGRGSHHPLIAFLNEPKMVANAWMRTGDSASQTDFEAFLTQTLEIVSPEKIGLVRADSGFSGNNCLTFLESKQLKYVVAMRLNSGIVEKVLACKEWEMVKDGIETATFTYKAAGWGQSRRMVVLRKDIRKLPNSAGKTIKSKSLFQEQDDYVNYRYSVMVTNTDMSAAIVWSLYKLRAEAENQIKELKYDYHIDGFCLEKMHATEFAFRWIITAYNLMSFFRREVVSKDVTHTLSTLKFKCIAIGAYLSRSGRVTRLKLSAQDKKRDYLDSLFVKIKENSPIPI